MLSGLVAIKYNARKQQILRLEISAGAAFPRRDAEREAEGEREREKGLAFPEAVSVFHEFFLLGVIFSVSQSQEKVLAEW